MKAYVRFLFSRSQHKQNKIPKMISPSPTIELHVPSASTMKTAQKLPSFQSQHDHSVSNTNQLAPPIVVFHQPDTGKPVSIINKSVDNSKSLWNLDEINRFTRDIFKLNSGNTSDDDIFIVFFFQGDHGESNVHHHRIRLDW